ncbi:hypothetical protein HYPSUDRAFT_59059 [Hypholoma sublateritium FD-334 SS-4]|uniref:Uncharacterized protein n=1 Tax=Hypholoma sublateritium (strain FD-334 SS-4) TaxID=945553 RepID=A0A0D2NEC9_HYPSF|nr:hypothetical protein HYPSUDRAFT_59059 [Hypholoma sublateritium FD-334 SS-4]
MLPLPLPALRFVGRNLARNCTKKRRAGRWKWSVAAAEVVEPDKSPASATSTRMCADTLSDVPSGRPILTRSGAVFSPYATIEAVENTFGPGLHELLKAAVAAEDNPGSHNDDPGVEGDENETPSEGNVCLNTQPICSQDRNKMHAAPTLSPSLTVEDPMRGPGPATKGSEQPFSQSRGNRQRKRKREANIIENGYSPSPKMLKRHVYTATPVETGLNVQDLPATSCGYAATNYPTPTATLPAAIQDLVDKGYEVIKNDGKTTKVFVGPDGHIFAIAVGQPCDPTYKEDHDEGTQL